MKFISRAAVDLCTSWAPAKQRAERREGDSASAKRPPSRQDEASSSTKQRPFTRERLYLAKTTDVEPSWSLPPAPKSDVEQGPTCQWKVVRIAPPRAIRGSKELAEGRKSSCQLTFHQIKTHHAEPGNQAPSEFPRASSTMAAVAGSVTILQRRSAQSLAAIRPLLFGDVALFIRIGS